MSNQNSFEGEKSRGDIARAKRAYAELWETKGKHHLAKKLRGKAKAAKRKRRKA